MRPCARKAERKTLLGELQKDFFYVYRAVRDPMYLHRVARGEAVDESFYIAVYQLAWALFHLAPSVREVIIEKEPYDDEQHPALTDDRPWATVACARLTGDDRQRRKALEPLHRIDTRPVYASESEEY